MVAQLFHSQLLENARHDISDTNIQCQSTSSIFRKLNFMLPFHFFNSTRHNDSVMPSLVGFYCLRELDISFCSILYIPDTIASLHHLERLLLMGNNFVTLPCIIKELPRLICLNLDNCKHLTSLSEFPLCTVLPVEKEPVHWTKIAGLHLFNCPKLVERESWSSIAVSWMIQLLKVRTRSFILSFPVFVSALRHSQFDFVVSGAQGMHSTHYHCYSWNSNSLLVQPSKDAWLVLDRAQFA